MSNVLQTARNELSKVLDEIQKAQGQLVELEAKAQKLKTFLKLSSDLGFTTEENQKMVPISVKQIYLGYTRPPRHQKDVITDFCANELKHGFPMKTSELLQLLTDAGIELGSANKSLALSALLSKDDRFEPNRKEGWTLKK